MLPECCQPARLYQPQGDASSSGYALTQAEGGRKSGVRWEGAAAEVGEPLDELDPGSLDEDEDADAIMGAHGAFHIPSPRDNVSHGALNHVMSAAHECCP